MASFESQLTQTVLELLRLVPRELRPRIVAPGSSKRGLLIIWQPLQMPNAKVSVRPKNSANISARRGLKRIVFAQPSPRRAHRRKRNRRTPLHSKVRQRDPAFQQIAHVNVVGVEPERSNA